MIRENVVITVQVKMLVSQLCPTLCDPMNCSLPGSSAHGILQARITGVGSHTQGPHKLNFKDFVCVCVWELERINLAEMIWVFWPLGQWAQNSSVKRCLWWLWGRRVTQQSEANVEAVSTAHSCSILGGHSMIFQGKSVKILALKGQIKRIGKITFVLIWLEFQKHFY